MSTNSIIAAEVSCIYIIAHLTPGLRVIANISDRVHNALLRGKI